MSLFKHEKVWMRAAKCVCVCVRLSEIEMMHTRQTRINHAECHTINVHVYVCVALKSPQRLMHSFSDLSCSILFTLKHRQPNAFCVGSVVICRPAGQSGAFDMPKWRTVHMVNWPTACLGSTLVALSASIRLSAWPPDWCPCKINK